MALLEHERDHAVGRAHREQVGHRGLDRQQHRAEGQQEHDEAERRPRSGSSAAACRRSARPGRCSRPSARRGSPTRSVPLTALGITLSRRSSTRSSVLREDGAVVGMAVRMAASPFLSTTGWDTDFTPEVLAMSLRSVCSRGSLAGDSRCFFWSACFCWSDLLGWAFCSAWACASSGERPCAIPCWVACWTCCCCWSCCSCLLVQVVELLLVGLRGACRAGRPPAAARSGPGRSPREIRS